MYKLGKGWWGWDDYFPENHLHVGKGQTSGEAKANQSPGKLYRDTGEWDGGHHEGTRGPKPKNWVVKKLRKEAKVPAPKKESSSGFSAAGAAGVFVAVLDIIKQAASQAPEYAPYLVP